MNRSGTHRKEPFMSKPRCRLTNRGEKSHRRRQPILTIRAACDVQGGNLNVYIMKLKGSSQGKKVAIYIVIGHRWDHAWGILYVVEYRFPPKHWAPETRFSKIFAHGTGPPLRHRLPRASVIGVSMGDTYLILL